MMNLYWVTDNKQCVGEILDYLNFEIVLIRNGCFPRKTCIWMGWKPPGDNRNEELFRILDDGGDPQPVGAEHQTCDEDDKPSKGSFAGEAGFKAGENIFNKIYHNYMENHRKVW